jgi:hypothetical protein
MDLSLEPEHDKTVIHVNKTKESKILMHTFQLARLFEELHDPPNGYDGVMGHWAGWASSRGTFSRCWCWWSSF